MTALLTRRTGRSSGALGSSIIELMGVLLVIFTLLVGVVAVSDFVLAFYRTGRAVDRLVYNQRLKPLSIDSSGATFVDEARLRRDLDSLIADFEAELRDELGYQSSNDYRIEAQIARVDVAPEDGVVRRVQIIPQLTRREGSLSISADLEEATNLEEEFQRLSGDIGSLSPYAVPDPSGEGRFVPVTALFGIRAFVSIAESPTSKMLSDLGVIESSVVYDVRAVALRGEVG